MRPRWSQVLAMSRSALPYERLEHAAAKPVIVPDTIVIDHGSVFVSGSFRASALSRLEGPVLVPRGSHCRGCSPRKHAWPGCAAVFRYYAI
jgi:hypothetical protein